ncbi:MAG: hypothetical protein K2O41_03030 [Clostridia bacterium]|nr:hypothetical protein [Clostridia bacterium]
MYGIYTGAILGDATSQFELGKSLIHKNKRIALFWFEKSAKNGNDDALCAVALCSFYGVGTLLNKRKALQLWAEANIRGNKIAHYALKRFFDIGK